MAEPTPALIAEAQAGDPEALGMLIVSQQQYMYSIAMSVLRQPEDAADLTQEACVKLLRVLGQYNGESRFTTWLYRLIVNMGRDELRRRGRRVPELPVLHDDNGGELDPLQSIADDGRWSDPAAVAANVELQRDIRTALDSLEDHYRLALTLYYFDDLRYNDIAEILDVPLNTVKSYIRRGKERLAVILASAEPEAPAPQRPLLPAQPEPRLKPARFAWALGRR